MSSFTGLWRGLVVSDGLNGLPFRPDGLNGLMDRALDL